MALELLETGLGAAAGRGDGAADVGRVTEAEQLGGAGGGLDDQLAGELGVEAVLGARDAFVAAVDGSLRRMRA